MKNRHLMMAVTQQSFHSADIVVKHFHSQFHFPDSSSAGAGRDFADPHNSDVSAMIQTNINK
jgi:hypothetical protein